jgi:hypothetical protein
MGEFPYLDFSDFSLPDQWHLMNKNDTQRAIHNGIFLNFRGGGEEENRRIIDVGEEKWKFLSTCLDSYIFLPSSSWLFMGHTV